MPPGLPSPAPGQYWKTPFYWEAGCPPPQDADALRFDEAPRAWLHEALIDVLAAALNEGDRHVVAQRGAAAAADELLAEQPGYFRWEPAWWRRALDAQGRAVGFVLPVLIADERKWRDGRPLGSIFYMGVLPAQRGQGHARALLDEALRQLLAAGCTRVFCDTGSSNGPMLAAFRARGWIEKAPWQRPLD